MDAQLDIILTQLSRVLTRVERLLEESDAPETLEAARAFTWQRGGFRPVRHVDTIRLAELRGIDAQLTPLVRNTRQFLRGAPANHVLLWGERGTGKSSAVKALLAEFGDDGLRLVQVGRRDLLDLPDIIDALWDRPERYILFCDDLSFDSSDEEYKELKALLEGGLHARPANVLVYATSNRRHLMHERLADRQGQDDVHPMDARSEQLSLADRFGLRLGFYPVDQATFLEIVHSIVATRGLTVDPETLERDALRWALSRNGRSGRSARQFVDDLQGRLVLETA
jgi:predicted AAA+ superfamily ATPase